MTRQELDRALESTAYRTHVHKGRGREFEEAAEKYGRDTELVYGHLWMPGGQDFSGWVWAETEAELVDILVSEARRLELI